MTLLLPGSLACPPRYRLVSETESSAGREAIDLAASAGVILDDWQQVVLVDALAESSPGWWSHRSVVVVVPRQNGKGEVLLVRELAGLFLFGERLQTHTAHRFDTSQEHFRRIVEVIDGCDDLRRQVKRIRYANGDEGIELLNGNRLNFKARSKGSGRGFADVDLIVLDEAYYLHDLGSLVPSMAANPNQQVWFTSSAPIVGDESDVLRGLCARGRKGADGMAYLEWSAAVDADLDDQGAWAEANPAIGVGRLSVEFTQTERQLLTDDEFARERLGIWNPDEAKPSLIPKAELAACVDDHAAPGGVLTFAVEMTPAADADNRTTATIVAAGTQGDHPVLEVVDHRSGQSGAWIVPRIVELVGRHEYRHVVLDAGRTSAAASLIDDLEAAGVRVLKLETKDVIRASAGIFDAILDGTLRYNGEALFTAAALAVTKRDVWGTYVWSHNPKSGTSSTPFLAGAFALHGLTAEAPSAPTVAIGAVYR